jgi:hypothetical protein
MNNEITYKAKLVAKEKDYCDYITYVFKNTNSTSSDDEYIMCVQFPNWDQSTININDSGYLHVRYVQEGVSQWFDGNTLQYYKYTNIIFLKFIPDKPTQKILID